MTLRHAAEISPFVHDRSIGPDIDLVDYKENELPKDRLNGESIETAKNVAIKYKNKINQKKEEVASKSHANEKTHKEPNCLHVSL